MLIRPADRAWNDEEWKGFVRRQGFGQLIAAGRGSEVPCVAPTHFAYDGQSRVIMHFVKDNPILQALHQSAMGLLAVVGDVAFIPGYVNAGEESPPEWGVPTSYYAAVQLIGKCRIVDDPAEMARILTELLDRFQPEGRHEPVEAGNNPYGRQFSAIRGVEMAVQGVHAKFKFGGNRPMVHRDHVAEALAKRQAPGDAGVLEHMARRRGTPPAKAS